MGKWTIPLIGLLLAIAVGVGLWGTSHYNARRDLEVTVANRYQSSFHSLLDNIEKVEVGLAKTLVANGMPENVRHLSGIWQEAMTGQANLSQLPLGHDGTMSVSKFLTQAGDYAYMLMRGHTFGQNLTEKDKEQLTNLRKQANVLSRNLHEIRASASEGRLQWMEIEQGARRKLPRIGATAKDSTENNPFTTISESIDNFPTLIYDGPFSDQVAQRKPKGLTGADISEEEARDKVLAFLPGSLKEGTALEKHSDIKGTIAGYTFVVRPTRGRGIETAIDISRKGGHILTMMNYRNIEDARLDLEEAGAKATAFLASKGFKNMVPTYAARSGNMAAIPFAPEIDEVLIYPDLIKVNVALDNGEIVGYEALGYVMAHHDRTIEQPKVSEEEARAAVNSELKVDSTRLAIIPRENTQEALCYEFKGVDNNDEPYFIYVDAMTGEEINILKIISDDDGTTTI